ncbi:MAG: cell division protein FtsQ [Cryomorphaceae bacterium]|jgi:cell division protein FtsQ
MSASNRARAFANQEKQAQSERFDRLGRTMILGVATLLTFATISLLAIDRLYRPDTFVIDQLKIKGKLRHMQANDVENLINELGVGNFFSIELEKIKSEVEGLAWVQKAEVRREWPNTLLIEVREHRPVMRWNKNKWVNSVGDVVDLPGEISVSNSIQLLGRDKDSAVMLRQAYVWKKRLAADGIQLQSLELSGAQAWTLGLLKMDTAAQFELLLGREQVEERLSRFQYLYHSQFRTTHQRLKRVDARYPDGLAIKSEQIKSNNAAAMSNGELTMRN